MPRIFELDLDPTASPMAKADSVASRLVGLIREHGFYGRPVRITREKEVIVRERAVYTFDDEEPEA